MDFLFLGARRGSSLIPRHAPRKHSRETTGPRSFVVRSGRTYADFQREQQQRGGAPPDPFGAFDPTALGTGGDRPNSNAFSAFDGAAFGNVDTTGMDSWNIGRKDERNMHRTNLNRR